MLPPAFFHWDPPKLQPGLTFTFSSRSNIHAVAELAEIVRT
jgi:hypothetical protein